MDGLLQIKCGRIFEGRLWLKKDCFDNDDGYDVVELVRSFNYVVLWVVTEIYVYKINYKGMSICAELLNIYTAPQDQTGNSTRILQSIVRIITAIW
jgi:hypothetical protein